MGIRKLLVAAGGVALMTSLGQTQTKIPTPPASETGGVQTPPAPLRVELPAKNPAPPASETGDVQDLSAPLRVELPANLFAGGLREERVASSGAARGALAAGLPSFRYINRKSVLLTYDARVGPSGLTKASLYTADETFEWKIGKVKGATPAPPNPVVDAPRPISLSFVYEVPKDGTYNFIIIAENHRGPSRRRPMTGDIGDIKIVVDTTPPVVEIVSTKVSANSDRGAAVEICWKATDLNIAPVPIKLEYRSSKSEWKSITADWTDNTGRHTWIAPIGEDHEFFIRVRSRDRAGNIGEATTEKPVNVDVVVPAVQIRDAIGIASGVSVKR